MKKAIAPRLAIVCILAGLFLAHAAQAETDLNLQDIIKETQRMAEDPDKLTLVWWMPVEFWIASLSQDPTVEAADIEQFVTTLGAYTMVVVVDAKMGMFGGMTYTSEEKLRETFRFVDIKGQEHKPLAADRVDADTKNLLQMMRPILANMLGPMGQNMHFFLFEGKDKKDAPVADAKGEGFISFLLAEHTFKFRLPLGSVLPPKFDPQTGERFPGNYNYNPFTGRKLTSEAPKI